MLVERLRDFQGQPLRADTAALRVLEKTPKNALRIPFFAELYPDARFVFLGDGPQRRELEARAFALDCRIPYTYFDLAKTSLSYPFSIVLDQTLKCYHPLAQASVVGVRVS